MLTLPDATTAPTILIVDDEPDIHQVTRITLRTLRFDGRRIKFVSAHSAKEALEILRNHPEIAVVLLDVVMESDHAGLEACDAIRGELGNRFVRILLRTGQPGQAPERETIDNHDLDGYLPKGELTSSRLYAAVRTALRSWRQLIDVERQTRAMLAIGECTSSLHAYEPVEVQLDRVLDRVFSLHDTPMAVLFLETWGGDGRRFVKFRTTDEDLEGAGIAAERLATRLRGHDAVEIDRVDEGVVLPLRLHRDLGRGWILLRDLELDDVGRRTLPLLAAQVANALYASVAQSALDRGAETVFGDVLV